MTGFAFCLVVTDGAVLRTIHPAAMGEHAAEIERIALTLSGAARAASAPVARKPDPPISPATMTQAEIARAQGFTGDVCRQCGSFAMKRTGTCQTCTACGFNEGCG